MCAKAFAARRERVSIDVSPLASSSDSTVGVVGRIDQHRHVGMVLGRGAQHRRPADVDVLDRFVIGAVGPRDRRGERIEIDDQQVDRLDAVLGA